MEMLNCYYVFTGDTIFKVLDCCAVDYPYASVNYHPHF